jgi:hypothetical protein
MFIPCTNKTNDPVVGEHSVEKFPAICNNRMFLAEGQTVTRLDMVTTTVDDCLIEGGIFDVIEESEIHNEESQKVPSTLLCTEYS